MRKICSAPALKIWEAATAESIPGGSLTLMERAATAVSRELRQRFPPGCRVSLFCGHGNNGGDGFAVARLLKEQGYTVYVFCAAMEKTVSPDALRNRQRLVELGVPLTPAAGLTAATIPESDVIIDALLGCGINRPVGGEYAEIISLLNTLAIPKLAVDLPSGLPSELPDGIFPAKRLMLRADWTVVPGCGKPVLLHPAALNVTGELTVADIGLCRTHEAGILGQRFFSEPADAVAAFPARQPHSHKYHYGHLAAVGGETGKAGAVFMAAKAAFLVGAGLVSIQSTPENRRILQTLLPEAMCILPEAPDSSGQWPTAAWPDKLSAVVCGPGLGRSNDAYNVTARVFDECSRRGLPTVIDADAINLMAAYPELRRKLPAGCVLTPHIGEFWRLVGADSQEPADPEHRLNRLSELCRELSAVIVLKDSLTVIADPQGNLIANPTGTPALAKAGSGDVLAGMIGGLLAQGIPPGQAAVAAVYVHGLCGRNLAAASHPISLLASRLPDCIPEVLHQLILLAAKNEF